MIKWRTFNNEQSFAEQASPAMPPEGKYDITVTNVVQAEVKKKGSSLTCECTIDNGKHRPYCFEKRFWFSDTAKQDYSVAELNALLGAAGFTPELPKEADVTIKQLAIAIPINELRLNIDCVHKYQVKIWVDKNSHKSASDDPGHGYTQRGSEQTDTLKFKKYIDVEKAAYDTWLAKGGSGFASMEPRRGGYVEMALIYQPAVKDSERSVGKDNGETPGYQEGDDDLPF